MHTFLELDRHKPTPAEQSEEPEPERKVTAWQDQLETLEPLDSQLSAEAAKLNTICAEASITELFELLDSDGNRSLDLQELKVVHGSSSTLEAFFKDWDADGNQEVTHKIQYLAFSIMCWVLW